MVFAQDLPEHRALGHAAAPARRVGSAPSGSQSPRPEFTPATRPQRTPPLVEPSDRTQPWAGEAAYRRISRNISRSRADKSRTARFRARATTSRGSTNH